MKLELNNEYLWKQTERFDFYNPQIDPKELVEMLSEAMIRFNGIGLSCNQVGLPYRVFIMGDPKDASSIIPVFNPDIIHYSDEQELAEEGCLSFPNYTVDVKRPKDIRTRISTVDGNRDSARFTGITSRIFQHEYDHMDGIDFRKRASRFHKERADKKYKQFLRRQKRVA